MSYAVACFTSNTGLDQEALRVAVVAAKGQHFADDAAAGLALDMDHEIDGFCNFGFGVGESRLRVVAHDQIGEAMQRLLRRIGMDRRERSGVASVEGIEQRARLDSAYFAQDDAVRPPSESGLEKVVESDVGFERIRLAFDRQYVRLLDLKFRSIFDNDEAFLFRNEVSQYPQKRGLSGTRSATDKQRLSAANLLGQEVRKRARQRAASNEVIDCVMAAGEFSDDECRRRPNNRRNDRRQGGSHPGAARAV